MSIRILLIDNEFKAEQLSDDLKALYEIYKTNLEKKVAFRMLQHLKRSNKEAYLHQCQLLADKVKYVTFRKDRETFEVRPVINGKRKFLGASADFEEACGFIKIYIQSISN